MKKGKLYGVGVGPGDKELITLKALRVLRESDVIMVPVMRSGEKTAFGIVEEYIDGKEIVECRMPMTKDLKVLNENYEAICDNVSDYLDQGKNAAFITLGDPTVYSSYMQVNELMMKRGYETEIIPGITSFCAAAARLNMSLCERDETLTILPSSYKNVREGLHTQGTKVLMKANRAIIEVRDILREEGMIDQAVMVECCGMENEKIYKDLNELDDRTSYFSIIIVKD